MSSRREIDEADRGDKSPFKWDWVATLLLVLAVVFILLFSFELWISHGR